MSLRRRAPSPRLGGSAGTWSISLSDDHSACGSRSSPPRTAWLPAGPEGPSELDREQSGRRKGAHDRLGNHQGCREPCAICEFERSFIADYRGGVTCLYDTQLLGACLHVGLETGTQSVCSGTEQRIAVNTNRVPVSVRFPYSERPYKFTLASSGVLAHNQRSGDSSAEAGIVSRGVAVPDGFPSSGSRRK